MLLMSLFTSCILSVVGGSKTFLDLTNVLVVEFISTFALGVIDEMVGVIVEPRKFLVQLAERLRCGEIWKWEESPLEIDHLSYRE